ncbi:MAG: hypothetical protein IJC27_09140 [Lentisphaeria bacterium]|nr:hypothetical protein [Lentisphaeria bacterium]
MKRILILMLLIMLAATGCYNRRALDRRPQPKPKPHHTRQHDRKKNDGKLFDSVFHRNPHRLENSNLTPAERRLIEEHDLRNDRDLNKARKKYGDTRNQDWVFGTKNGSVF